MYCKAQYGSKTLHTSCFKLSLSTAFSFSRLAHFRKHSHITSITCSPYLFECCQCVKYTYMQDIERSAMDALWPHGFAARIPIAICRYDVWYTVSWLSHHLFNTEKTAACPHPSLKLYNPFFQPLERGGPPRHFMLKRFHNWFDKRWRLCTGFLSQLQNTQKSHVIPLFLVLISFRADSTTIPAFSTDPSPWLFDYLFDNFLVKPSVAAVRDSLKPKLSIYIPTHRWSSQQHLPLRYSKLLAQGTIRCARLLNPCHCFIYITFFCSCCTTQRTTLTWCESISFFLSGKQVVI